MDFVAEMLLLYLQREHADRYDAHAVAPRFFNWFESIPWLDARKAWNADRLVTRFITYPLQLLTRRRGFELFHIADHSYAHLTHVLPAERTGVYCHDLDAFACLLRPEGPAPTWRRVMARRQLTGLQRAAVVFYSTDQIRKEIEQTGILAPERLVHAPYGVAPDFFFADGVAELPPGALPSRPFVLHVGSNVPRKRLDVLFRAFGALRAKHPELMLVQRGARLLPHQSNLVAELGIGDAIVQPPHLTRPALAALYRRAELVLITSEREGFGLPILEALAAGATVIASDIPAFREVAGEAVTFCPVGDVQRWSQTIERLLEEPSTRPTPSVRRAVAERYTWTAHAATISDAYARLAGLEGARA
jgi:glycosyltransferase involved in cell wall biosynthesis